MSVEYIPNDSAWVLIVCLFLLSRYNGYTREAYFSVGLQGIAEKDVKTVRELVDRTIEEVIEYVCVCVCVCDDSLPLLPPFLHECSVGRRLSHLYH
jgi:hypothetical protein